MISSCGCTLFLLIILQIQWKIICVISLSNCTDVLLAFLVLVFLVIYWHLPRLTYPCYLGSCFTKNYLHAKRLVIGDCFCFILQFTFTLIKSLNLPIAFFQIYLLLRFILYCVNIIPKIFLKRSHCLNCANPVTLNDLLFNYCDFVSFISSFVT